MKGVLIGCGIILAIVVIVFVVIGYFGVKFVKDVKQDMMVYQESFRELNIKYPFQEPANGLIGKNAFQRWLAVRKDMSLEIAGYDTLTKQFSWKTIQKIKEHTLNMVKQLTGVLDSVGLSPKEYLWITQQTIGALQSGDIRKDPDFQDIVAAFDDMTRDGGKGSHTNMDDLAVPVTSEQIKRIALLIRADKQVFLENIKVFYADMAIYGFMQMNEGLDKQKAPDEDQVVLLCPEAPCI